jgi:hypothetical protein
MAQSELYLFRRIEAAPGIGRLPRPARDAERAVALFRARPAAERGADEAARHTRFEEELLQPLATSARSRRLAATVWSRRGR